MRIKVLITLGLCALTLGLVSVGCKREKPAVKIDPHSPEGVNKSIQDQIVPLRDALKTNDLKFIHNQMYYIEGLADALSYRLTGEKKQRVDAILADLKKITEELDNSAGRHHQAATEANMQNLFAVIKELDAEFNPPDDKKIKK